MNTREVADLRAFRKSREWSDNLFGNGDKGFYYEERQVCIIMLESGVWDVVMGSGGKMYDNLGRAEHDLWKYVRTQL